MGRGIPGRSSQQCYGPLFEIITRIRISIISLYIHFFSFETNLFFASVFFLPKSRIRVRIKVTLILPTCGIPHRYPVRDVKLTYRYRYQAWQLSPFHSYSRVDPLCYYGLTCVVTSDSLVTSANLVSRSGSAACVLDGYIYVVGGWHASTENTNKVSNKPPC